MLWVPVQIWTRTFLIFGVFFPDILTVFSELLKLLCHRNNRLKICFATFWLWLLPSRDFHFFYARSHYMVSQKLPHKYCPPVVIFFKNKIYQYTIYLLNCVVGYFYLFTIWYLCKSCASFCFLFLFFYGFFPKDPIFIFTS